MINYLFGIFYTATKKHGRKARIAPKPAARNSLSAIAGAYVMTLFISFFLLSPYKVSGVIANNISIFLIISFTLASFVIFIVYKHLNYENMNKIIDSGEGLIKRWKAVLIYYFLVCSWPLALIMFLFHHKR